MPVNEYGQMIGESMEGYTPGALPSIDLRRALCSNRGSLGRKACEGFASCLWPGYSSRDVDLPLSGTSGRQRGTGYSFKSDVGS